MQYYIHHNNAQIGPFTEAEVKAKLASGEITAQDHVWWQGQEGWVALSQTPLVGSAAPTIPVSPTAPVVPGTAAAAAYPVGAPQSTNLPLWAMICGIIGILLVCPSYICAPIFILGIIPTITAVVLGHIALSAIKKNPGREGRGMALAGLVMGYFSVVMLAVYIAIILIFVGFNHNFRDVMEKIQQQINSAQAMNGNPADQMTNSAPATTNTAPGQ